MKAKFLVLLVLILGLGIFSTQAQQNFSVQGNGGGSNNTFVVPTNSYIRLVPCPVPAGQKEKKGGGFWKKFGKLVGEVVVVGSAVYFGEMLAEKVNSVPLKILIIGSTHVVGEKVNHKLFEGGEQQMCGEVIAKPPAAIQLTPP